jgi:NADPH:quinone reductase-like Zn-dependent oxidoreductase
LPTPEFVEAVNNFYTHHMRFRLVAELALCAAACEVIAKLRALGVATLHFIGAQRGRSGAQAMRQIWITKFGPPEVLAFRQAPDPEPKPGEVRIRVEASGVNFADIVGRVGFYPDLPPIPVVPGYEISGRIDAVGAGVDTSWIGRDVLAMTRFGGYADVICVPVRQIFACPPGMSALEAAALPVNYFTAWQLVVIVGGFQFNPMSLISANKGVFGVNLGHLWGEMDRIRGWGEQLLDLWTQGVIKPKIARSFKFDEAADAHHFIQDRKNIGKVLLLP